MSTSVHVIMHEQRLGVYAHDTREPLSFTTLRYIHVVIIIITTISSQRCIHNQNYM